MVRTLPAPTPLTPSPRLENFFIGCHHAGGGGGNSWGARRERFTPMTTYQHPER
jgi:hypothetical protein